MEFLMRSGVPDAVLAEPARPTAAEGSSRAMWFAYAASMWAVLFAAGSLYLAAGGTVGTALLADEIRQRILVRDPAFVTALWVTAVLKLAAAVFAVALSRSWRPVVRKVMTVLAWITGVALSVWGSGYVVMGIFLLCGAVETPPSWGSGAARWYALVWGPLWMVGGALFLASARFLPHVGGSTRHTR